MTFEVQLSPAALRQLDPAGRRRMQAVIDLLAEDPRPPAARQLVGGAGEWRVRTGDFRIIYEIHDRQLLAVTVTRLPRPAWSRLPVRAVRSARARRGSPAPSA